MDKTFTFSGREMPLDMATITPTTFPAPPASLCWICGDPATSREHLVKRSDLRALLGHVSQSKPIYVHTARSQNRPVGSLNADALKFSSRLCEFCNTTRTQPHDYDWDRLSEALRLRSPSIAAGQFVRINSVFPHDTRRAMRHVHLYFVKLFGCKLVEGGIPIETKSFADAIKNDRLHPNLYLVFGPKPGVDKIVAGGTDVHTFTTSDGTCAVAFWIHQVGDLWVNVVYAADGHSPPMLRDTWHPRRGAQRLKMSHFTP